MVKSDILPFNLAKRFEHIQKYLNLGQKYLNVIKKYLNRQIEQALDRAQKSPASRQKKFPRV